MSKSILFLPFLMSAGMSGDKSVFGREKKIKINSNLSSKITYNVPKSMFYWS